MKYYKLMKDFKIFGVCNSNDFKYYNPNSNLILSSDEIHGQLIRYKQQLYRDYWMTDLPANFNRAYELVKVAEITDNEFNVLFEMLSKIDYITESKEESGTPVITVVPSTFQEEPTIEAVRKLKLQELSNICNQTIENGFDTTLSDNISHHFSLTTQDQLNLISIGQMAANGMEMIPYHADGEICKFYSPDDINNIIEAATQYKIYHTTYYNALKNYVNSLDDINTIQQIEYGVVLPVEYQSDVLRALE